MKRCDIIFDCITFPPYNKVESLQKPIDIELNLFPSSLSDPNLASCRSMQDESSVWDDAGLVVSSTMRNGSLVTTICSTYHLSLFTVAAEQAIPGFNSITPLGIKAIRQDLTLSSTIALTMLLFSLIVFVIHVIVFCIAGTWIQEELWKARKLHFMMHGRVTKAILDVTLELIICRSEMALTSW